ncbi:DUF3093 domain-containing protein [Brevibacterium litoralis]|uniref:DUF3093 domain-containing protein n=1 Tax=Brevibacterium litoralis TaxID=3138935 RepID=UPI0032EDECAD
MSASSDHLSPTPGDTTGPSDTVLHAERLWPPFSWWFVTACLSAMTSLMVIPIWSAGGVIVPVVVFLLAVLGLRAASPRIVVTADALHVGRAWIEREFVTDVEAFDAEESFAERGPRMDARAFFLIRPWVKRVAKITIDDASDDTPYWLVSSRDPEALAAALR